MKQLYMKKKCELENCTKNATYAYIYGKPERCKEHKENRKPQYTLCTCGNRVLVLTV